MKNIPMFTSAFGVATLVLREIPWSGRAYVLVRSVWRDQTAALLAECRDFCRACGAEEVYAAWETAELPAEHAYDMVSMSCAKAALPLPSQAVELEPLTPENGGDYLEIYNVCFRQVPSAASYGREDLRRLQDQDKAWLARVDGRYAAVAEISEQGLEGIAVLPPYRGLGYHLALAVLPMVPAKTVALKVASTNRRAMDLYRRIGFAETGITARWYKL